jgi:hypothetical protein
MKTRILLSLMALMVGTLLTAQTSSNPYTLHFRTATVIPDANTEAWLASVNTHSENSFNQQFFKIIQFNNIPSDAVKQMLRQHGITLLDYMPQNAYYATFADDFNPLAMQDAGIRGILDIQTDWKRSPLLYEGNFPEYALSEGNRISVLISWYASLNADAVVSDLAAKGYQLVDRYDFGHYANFIIPVNEIETVASLPYVLSLEPVNPEPEPENSTGRTLHRTNVLSSDYAAGRHYDGTGVHVMLQDDGIIGPHIDYEGRIGAQNLGYNSGDHGDHCAGIIMAAGNIDPLARGNAPGATIYVYSANNYPGFSAIPTVYGTLDMRITSTSYGDGCNSGYNSLARMLDQQVRNYASVMHVFSTGNSGTSNCGYGAGAGWGNITGGHKVGKNVISVANLSFIGALSNSSSRGPAHDGRIKPDLAAKGSTVWSTVDENDYDHKSGTSMACPGVAGTLASLYHAYRDIYNGEDPTGGLAKGILLNTAEDLGNPGPDFKFGWGRINARRAVEVMEDGRFDSAVLNQGDVVTLPIDVPSGTAQVRVMVYWTDYEATINTTWALVNNLDMTLTDPSSTTWLPWKLSHYPHPDSLDMPAFRGVDDRNNMEQVTLDNPAAGTYTVEILGTSVPQGPQTCYIIWEFIPEALVLTYPVGGEPLVPGTTETIRWDAFGETNNFTLEYSTDNGQTWDTIAEDVSPSIRYYNWNVPPTTTGLGLVRISDGNSVSQSEAPFTILGTPCNITIDWVCDDAMHLTWGSVPGATGYEVLVLGEKYMEVVGSTDQPHFLYEAPGLSDATWVTVRALGPDDAIGQRAYAIEKEAGTSNCAPTDAMLASIPSASWGVFPAILTVEPQTVTIEVYNNGTEPVVNPTVYFKLNNETPHSETLSGTIDPDESVFHTFGETIDISQTGLYVVRTWVEYGPDQNPDNDYLEVPVEIVDHQCISFGYMQNFDGWDNCSSAPICELYTCEVADDWRNLTNEDYDEHDWRTYNGTTSTAQTGPTYDHTTGTFEGQYLYLEPSLFCFNKEALLHTPCMDLTNGVASTASFWYHAYGADLGWLHIDLFDGNAIHRDVVDPIAGSQVDAWQMMDVDLSAWVGQVVQLQFRGVTACDEKGDLAIDDFSLTDITADDPGIVASDQSTLKLYPNPANDQVTLVIPRTAESVYQMKISSLFGQTIMDQTLAVSYNGIREKIGLTNIPAGIYIVEVLGNTERYIARLVVTR